MRKLALSAVASLFICASLTTAPSLFAQQYPKGDFSLYDGQMEISDGSWQFNGQEQQLFSAAVIKVKGGKVTMEASVPYADTFEYGNANGTMSIGGEGQYDSQAGTISGTFTYTNNGSSAADDLSATLTSNCQGTFSSPPISSNQVTVSFAGTMNSTTTVGGTAIPDSRSWSRDVVYKVAADSGVRFSDLSGNVDILLPDAEEDDWRAAKLDMPLPNGTLIRTDEDSSAVLSFSDWTTFVTKPETLIRIDEYREEQGKFEILMGNVWVNIKKMLKDGSMKVEMSQAVAGIKGTVFSLEEDGTTSTLKVFEGTVDFESKATGESMQVEAGRTVSADKNGLGEIKDFDTEAEMAEWVALGAEPVLEPGPESESEPDGFPVWLLIVLIALAALILAVIIILLVRRSKAGKGAAEGTSQTGMPPLQGGPAPQNEPESQPAATGSFCTGCGTPLREGRAFCRNCGKKA